MCGVQCDVCGVPHSVKCEVYNDVHYRNIVYTAHIPQVFNQLFRIDGHCSVSNVRVKTISRPAMEFLDF